jgi:hypothetical protein
MPMQCTMIFEAGGLIRTPGLDFGRMLQFVKQVPERGTPQYIVTFRPGHSTWAGLGSQEYAPAEYAVFRVTKVVKEGEYLVDQLFDFPASRKKQREDR